MANPSRPNKRHVRKGKTIDNYVNIFWYIWFRNTCLVLLLCVTCCSFVVSAH